MSYCPLLMKNDNFYDVWSPKSSNFGQNFIKLIHNVKYHVFKELQNGLFIQELLSFFGEIFGVFKKGSLTQAFSNGTLRNMNISYLMPS